MAAKWTFVCFVCAMLLMVNSQTTQSLNGTGPSTSDYGNNESILDQSMVAFYKMVEGFLVVVQPNKLNGENGLNFTQIFQGGSISSFVTEWQQYTNYFVGFIICFVVGILFCIIMPIVGCCFCCCRCCGRCGGRRKVHDPKRARCKRGSYCTVLLILTTIMLAGVVCSFVANDLIHRYLKNEDNRGPVGRIESALTGVEKYINDTVDEVRDKTLNAFDDTRNDLVQQINNTGSTSVDRVANMLNASTFIQKAEELSRDVNAVEADLTDVKTHLTSLQTNGQALTDALASIKANVTALCPSPCNVDTSQYETDADFSGLSDLSTEAGNVAKSLNMTQLVEQAKDTIKTAKTDATGQIQDQVNSATSTLDTIRGNISKQISSFTDQITKTTDFATTGSRAINNAITPEVEKYFDYIWYAGIGLSSIYLLIVVCYYMGVLFGLCGERPGYDAPCCNKGIGANFLMAGVGFSFIFSWILMLVVSIFFIVGGPVFTEVCRHLDSNHPEDLQFASDIINQNLKLSESLYKDPGVHLDIVTVLEDCRDNKPVYETLQLQHLFNLTSLIDLGSIDDRLDDLGRQSFTLSDINILDSELEQKIKDFGDAGLDSINFTQFDTQMEKKLTKANLTKLAQDLRTEAQNHNQPIRQELEREADNLAALETTYVIPMQQDVQRLNASLRSLRAQQDIKDRTDNLVTGLRNAQNSFNNDSSRLVDEMVTNLTKALKETTRTNVNNLISDVTTNVGRCRPVYDSVYQMSDAVCKIMLNPFNSLWFSWGWCLFFFIPTIIFAVKLAGLYRREEEYSEKDFDDANFSMYGGPTPDTIPLTSRSHWG